MFHVECIQAVFVIHIKLPIKQSRHGSIVDVCSSIGLGVFTNPDRDEVTRSIRTYIGKVGGLVR